MTTLAIDIGVDWQNVVRGRSILLSSPFKGGFTSKGRLGRSHDISRSAIASFDALSRWLSALSLERSEKLSDPTGPSSHPVTA